MKLRITTIIFLVLQLTTLFAQVEFRMVTYNIRYDNPTDPYIWKDRKHKIATLLNENSLDIIAVQEALKHQIDELEDLLPAYNWIGVGRDDGKLEGEFCSIFYKRDSFELIESSTFWLAENSDSIGLRGWDAVCTRICTWATFTPINTTDTFMIFNTHLDHEGKHARAESLKLILSKINSLAKDSPVVLCGDFNFTRDDPAYQLLNDCTLHDAAKKNFEASPSSNFTFNHFNHQPEIHKAIDYIFTSDQIQVMNTSVVLPLANEIIPSDHNPLIATLILE